MTKNIRQYRVKIFMRCFALRKPVPALSADRLRPPLFLGVGYAANCGGMGTLTGTPPNLVFRGIVEQ